MHSAQIMITSHVCLEGLLVQNFVFGLHVLQQDNLCITTNYLLNMYVAFHLAFSELCSLYEKPGDIRNVEKHVYMHYTDQAGRFSSENISAYFEI